MKEEEETEKRKLLTSDSIPKETEEEGEEEGEKTFTFSFLPWARSICEFQSPLLLFSPQGLVAAAAVVVVVVWKFAVEERKGKKEGGSG